MATWAAQAQSACSLPTAAQCARRAARADLLRRRSLAVAPSSTRTTFTPKAHPGAGANVYGQLGVELGSSGQFAAVPEGVIGQQPPKVQQVSQAPMQGPPVSAQIPTGGLPSVAPQQAPQPKPAPKQEPAPQQKATPDPSTSGLNAPWWSPEYVRASGYFRTRAAWSWSRCAAPRPRRKMRPPTTLSRASSTRAHLVWRYCRGTKARCKASRPAQGGAIRRAGCSTPSWKSLPNAGQGYIFAGAALATAARSDQCRGGAGQPAGVVTTSARRQWRDGISGNNVGVMFPTLAGADKSRIDELLELVETQACSASGRRVLARNEATTRLGYGFAG